MAFMSIFILDDIGLGIGLNNYNHQNLRFTACSFLSAMASSLKLKNMTYTDVMKIYRNYQQLRNSRTIVMDYCIMRESKTHKKSDRIERIKKN